MQMTDSDFMLGLKNDPQTRKFAILTKEEIKREDHIKWLEKNVHEFQVAVEVGDRLVGAIRIHPIQPESGNIGLLQQQSEISIWITPDFRALGYGTTLIKMVRKHRMIAKIVIGNLPSMRAFIKAGFLPKEFIDDKYYIFNYKAVMYGEEFV